MTKVNFGENRDLLFLYFPKNLDYNFNKYHILKKSSSYNWTLFIQLTARSAVARGQNNPPTLPERGGLFLFTGRITNCDYCND
jgi:hypothetical protein